MSYKQYDYDAEELKTESVSAKPSKSNDSILIDELYERTNARFPVRWPAGAKATPFVDVEALPDGVSEQDIAESLTSMKKDGIL